VAAGQVTVALIATLDTKGPEAALLADLIRARGAKVRVYDTGTRPHPDGVLLPHVTSDAIAQAADTTIAEVGVLGSRGEAIAAMSRGLASLLPDDFRRGAFHRAIVIGGLNGSVVGAAGLQQLPFGVPKLIVTPVASGARQFATFVGTADIATMHSVVDLQGVNSFTTEVLNHAAAYITGPDLEVGVVPKERGALAITMNGNTTPVGMMIMHELDGQGWDVVAFHSNGVGGSAMERLAAEGRFAAIIDLTTNEIVDRELGGVYPGPPTRMRALAGCGLPTVFVPGCVDFINQNPAMVPEGRQRTRHSPQLDLVRVTSAEAELIGRIFAESVNLHSGSVEIIAPTRGFSPSAVAGGPLYDPAADLAFLHSLSDHLDSDIPVSQVDASINDPATARAVVEALGRVIERPSGRAASPTTEGVPYVG
jgi:uncharacterized protein (UPF0261 family)